MQATKLQVVNADFNTGENITFLANGAEITGYAGGILVRLDDGGTLDFYCVDLFHDITIGTYTVNKLAPRPVFNEGRVAWLLDTLLASISTPDQGAGLQLAIWDIVHDNGDGFSTGLIRSDANTNAAVLGFAQADEALSLGKSTQAGLVLENVAGRNAVQTLEGAIPELSTLPLVACGLGLLAFGRFGRRRTP
jgi:hypothetical protein